jgi:hypothetical protein
MVTEKNTCGSSRKHNVTFRVKRKRNGGETTEKPYRLVTEKNICSTLESTDTIRVKRDLTKQREKQQINPDEE